MAIEESKIKDLIEEYEGYQEDLEHNPSEIALGSAGAYRAVIGDLKKLLPRKTLADLGVTHFSNLSGTIVEYRGMRGVLLGGGDNMVTLFTFADKCATYTDPALVYALDEDRIWDEMGNVLK